MTLQKKWKSIDWPAESKQAQDRLVYILKSLDHGELRLTHLFNNIFTDDMENHTVS